MGSGQEEGKTERATGVGRRTREVIEKWNQITALGFQTRWRHQTPPASLLRWAVLSCIFRSVIRDNEAVRRNDPNHQ